MRPTTDTTRIALVMRTKGEKKQFAKACRARKITMTHALVSLIKLFVDGKVQI